MLPPATRDGTSRRQPVSAPPRENSDVLDVESAPTPMTFSTRNSNITAPQTAMSVHARRVARTAQAGGAFFERVGRSVAFFERNPFEKRSTSAEPVKKRS